jgi:hypothetical protein
MASGRAPVHLEPTVKLLPNWALAGVLAVFAGGTYWYAARAASPADAAAELEREAERQAAEDGG